MKILDNQQIQQKIKRLSYQILENNFGEDEIIFAGINNNGLGFAKLIIKELTSLTKTKITLTQIKLSPAAPLSSPITIDMELKDLENKVVIVVDDVANTGRTIFYAIRPLLDVLAKKVEVAVLIDRKHKSFPIRVDYLGLSLATTVKENIEVKIKDPTNQSVSLK